MKHMFIKQGSKYININLNNIQYIESNGDYCIFKCIDKQYNVKATMKSLETKLANYDFVRIHNKHIVNLLYVKSIDVDVLYIDSKYLSISRDKIKSFKNKIIVL